MGPLGPPTTSLATLVAAKDGFGPLCEVVAVETMVAQTDDSRLGDDSPMVTTMVGTK
jgi:hypothetical protein